MICNNVGLMKLSELKPGRVAHVRGVDAGSTELEAKLREVGFSEGDEVEMITSGPFGQPLAVRLNRTMVALRTSEAAAVKIAHD